MERNVWFQQIRLVLTGHYHSPNKQLTFHIIWQKNMCIKKPGRNCPSPGHFPEFILKQGQKIGRRKQHLGNERRFWETKPLKQ